MSTTTTNSTGSTSTTTSGPGHAAVALLILPGACTALVSGIVEHGDTWPNSGDIADIFHPESTGLAALVQGF